MFTATADLVIPTTVTGSWPRPRWFNTRLDGRALSTAMKDVVLREQLTDGLAVLLDDQERAGLDILTHGDYFHDEDLGGHQWHRYPLERWSGLKGDYSRISDELPTFESGSILNEVFGGWRWPKVVGKIEPNEDLPLEYAKIWRLTQARTNKPVKFGAVCAQGLHPLLEVVEGYDPDNRRELIWDLATAMNQELRMLAASGCKVIQIEEPLLHYLATFHPEQTEQIDFLVDAFNHEVSGLEDVEVWVHTCWGNPNMQRAVEDVSYANSVEVYMERLNADVWTIEATEHPEELKLLEPYKGSAKKKIAIGAVSHRMLQVETPENVAKLAREALKYIDAENLILSSDCGFGRAGNNRMIAFYKAVSLSLGANIVRGELGLEQQYVPAADPQLQVDVLEKPDASKLFAGLNG
jgi:5-methyltetrahydropteroyltriglutamate--homocysteine methyltransferase